jgi:ABC-2 type transport system ATP-binding protein
VIPCQDSDSRTTDAVMAVGVSKRVGRRQILQGVDFRVGYGEIVALLGANGAGKTSLIKILAGLSRPSAGEVLILGAESARTRVRTEIGLVLEEAGLIPGISATRNLKLLAAMESRKVDLPALLDRVGLPSTDHRPIRTWSQGMRRRLVIAQAVMSSPKLLLLDEPTNGLDPVGVVQVRDLLHDLRAAGTSIVISSHALTEIEKLCSRAYFLQGGRVVDEIDLADQKEILCVVASTGFKARAQDVLRALGVHIDPTGGPEILAVTSVPVSKLISELVRNEIPLEEVRRDRQSLESRFLALTGEG